MTGHMQEAAQEQGEMLKKAVSGTKEGVGPSSLIGIFKKALSLVGGRVGGNLLTLGYTLLLARLATPAEFGIVMSGFAWAMLISIGLALNVESGSIRYLVRYRDAEQNALAAGFIRFNRSIVLILSIATIALTAGVGVLGWIDLASETIQVLLLALIAAPVIALTRVYARHATALGQVLRGGLPIMLARPAVIYVLLAVVWFSGARPGPVVLMGLMLLAFVATALLQAFLLRATFAFAKDVTRDYDEKRQWLGTGFMMAPLLVLRDNLKHVVVASAGLVLAAEQVGYLALAMSIMALIYFAMKAVDISLSPQLSQALQAKNIGRVGHIIRTSAKLKIAGIGAGIAGVAVLGQWVLGLFGPSYLAAYMPLLALMLIPMADALFGPAQIVLNVSGRQSAVFWVAGLSTGVLVSAIALGGWLAGSEGAALGAGLSYLFQQSFLRLCSKKLAGVDTSVHSLIQKGVLKDVSTV